MQTKAYMSALAGAIFLAGSRAHWADTRDPVRHSDDGTGTVGLFTQLRGPQ